jgi:hypothetical protein
LIPLQGQTHGHSAFLLKPEEAKSLIAVESRYKDVVFPFLIANSLFASKGSIPDRYVIDFGERDLLSAQKYPKVYERIEMSVLPDRKKKAAEEKERNAEALEANPAARVNRHRQNFLKHWWRLSYRRADLMAAISKLDRYIVCGRVTKRPIFEFLSRDIHPKAALVAFPRDDDYTFGILQSSAHWSWFTERCSTL